MKSTESTQSRNLPNAALIIVFGSLSIIGCCFYFYVALVLGLVALYLAHKSTKIYNEDPHNYDNFPIVTVGKVLAIIGIVMNLLALAFVIWAVTTFGWDVIQDQELFQQELMDYFGIEQP